MSPGGAPAAALVTGASSGLGRCLARVLAARGRHLVLLARDEARLAETARAVEDAGGTADVVRADVRDRAALTSALAGRDLDIVLHAAGILELGPVAGLSADEIRGLLEVNVLGTVNVVAAALPALERRRGRIGVVSSVVAVLPVPGGFSDYAASKWALRGWGETVRPELAARGVSLTLAYPAAIDTPMLRGRREDGPAVYRAFGWHSPEKVAERLVRDVEERRRESWSSAIDRLAALGYRLAPATFARLFRLVTRTLARRAP